MRRALPFLLCFTVALAACVTTGSTPDASRTEGVPPTRAETARRLHDRRCGECHALYAPSSYTRAQWLGIMEDMGERAFLDEAQMQLVTEHVLAGR